MIFSRWRFFQKLNEQIQLYCLSTCFRSFLEERHFEINSPLVLLLKHFIMVLKNYLVVFEKKTIAFTRYFQKCHTIELSNSKKSHCNRKGGIILDSFLDLASIFKKMCQTTMYLLSFIHKKRRYSGQCLTYVLENWRFCKGQIISECPLEILDFPNILHKIWQISALESKKVVKS